jgi:predicted phosphodiesterase
VVASPAFGIKRTNWAGLIMSVDRGRPEGVKVASLSRRLSGDKDDNARWALHRCIYVLHDIKTLQFDPVSSGVDVIVCGHSHQPRIETIRGVLYLNPGSAGPRRFNLPITVATPDLTTGGLTPVIHHLGGAS